MIRIFISYRRDDTEWVAGRLHDALRDPFRPNRVFRDRDTIPFGADFWHVIEQYVDKCDAFIILIGERWLNICDESGIERLTDPEDIVHKEVAAALRSGKPVFPVLVGRARMPRAYELPTSLEALAARSGLELSDSHWADGVRQLRRALRRLPDSSWRSWRSWKRRHIMVTLAALLGSTALTGVVWATYTTTGYYVGVDGQVVALFKGPPKEILWLKGGLVKRTSLSVCQLPPDEAARLRSGDRRGTETKAEQYVQDLLRTYGTNPNRSC